MNYLESYIENTIEEKPTGTQGVYLLPGLVEYHTGADLTPEELRSWKRAYNDWLSMFIKCRIKMLMEMPTEEEKKESIRVMEIWAQEMYLCLQRIGRYTRKEMMEGFEV